MTREYVVKVTDEVAPDAFQRFETEWSPEQEIVRCQNCAHWHELKDSDPSRGVCKIWHMLHHGGWFVLMGNVRKVGEVGMKKEYIVELREEEADELMDEHWVGELVRCKDCKHRPKEPNFQTCYCGFDIDFPEDSKCPCQCDDGYYSWYPEDDWFCANGEVKQNENNAER